MSEVRDNRDKSRFELELDGELAIAEYRRRPDHVTFTHTEVPVALQGRGVASRLIAGALAQVRAEGLKVVPVCPFVRAYIERHPAEQDLLL